MFLNTFFRENFQEVKNIESLVEDKLGYQYNIANHIIVGQPNSVSVVQTSKMELFTKNCLQLSTGNYFYRKTSILDV